MADLVIEINRTRQRLTPGAAYYVVRDGDHLRVTTDERAASRLGFFGAGMMSDWYFHTPELGPVQHLRLDGEVVSNRTTMLNRPLIRLRWAEPAPNEPDSWWTKANIIGIVSVVLAVLGLIATVKLG